jgi:hypothetical protein
VKAQVSHRRDIQRFAKCVLEGALTDAGLGGQPVDADAFARLVDEVERAS